MAVALGHYTGGGRLLIGGAALLVLEGMAINIYLHDLFGSMISMCLEN